MVTRMVVPRRSRHMGDALVLALLVVAWVAVAAGDTSGSVVAQYVFPLGWTLPLLLRRSRPAWAALAVVGALALESQVVQPATESLAALPPVIWAFWLAGSIGDRATALATGGGGAVLMGIVLAANPGSMGAAEAAFLAIVVAAPFLGGLALGARERHASELLDAAADRAREQQERSQAAVSAERAQIARELHDVVGHAISVMTVQAGAARMLLRTEPEQARGPLLAVEEAGRQALAEMRRMLVVLRDQNGTPAAGPQPGLADLEGVVQRARDSGIPVEVVVEGEAVALEPGVDLAVFRIVQEALTNVLKHAPDTRAWVRIAYAGDTVDVCVENDGPAVAQPSPGGRGLVGMAERVALYRGRLDAGPREGGGFAVRARLPLGQEQA